MATGSQSGRGEAVTVTAASHFDAPGTLQMHGYAASVTSPRKQRALALFAGLPAQYDWMGAFLSFGQDRRWRRAMVGTLGVPPSARVLDVAAGTGLVTTAIVRRYGCRVVAVDQSEEMLGRARLKLERDPRLAGCVEIVRAEAEHLPFDDAAFDALTVGYLFRYVDDTAGTIRELARVVKPGGTVASLEFHVPSAPVLRALWNRYTRYGLPALGRLASRDWAAVGRFLADDIPAFYERCPLERQREEWRAAGIDGVQARPMSLGAGVVMWGARAAT
jgi:demethylmenaquinone methyltransferase / 2-methoxy-6-polyprenyl-1,4-benzoquinol methylase